METSKLISDVLEHPKDIITQIDDAFVAE